MSYQVLARQWRPRTFSDVVGQQHVLSALSNALRHQRLHHAYLLSGTRGVGKTTIARILSRSLNCLEGITAEPCGVCDACRQIDEGRFVDLLEIDAASRTKVEDTREILENVQYRPTTGRYKVYLIDEVHMLSRHSFNALLKTLEEPPPHAIFLLATTDPDKLPITVLSRCLQFNLRALTREEISGQLHKVLSAEAIPFEQGAIELLARAARGSMRDALSLTDQAIAQGNGEVREESVARMLGSLDPRDNIALLGFIANGDSRQALAHLRTLPDRMTDISDVLGELQNLLHQLALLQLAPEYLDSGLVAHRDAMQQLAQGMRPEQVQVWYRIVLEGRREIPLATDAFTAVEMTLLRLLSFRPVLGKDGGDAPAPQRTEAGPANVARQVSADAHSPHQSSSEQPQQTDELDAEARLLHQEQEGIQAQADRLRTPMSDAAGASSAPLASPPPASLTPASPKAPAEISTDAVESPADPLQALLDTRALLSTAPEDVEKPSSSQPQDTQGQIYPKVEPTPEPEYRVSERTSSLKEQAAAVHDLNEHSHSERAEIAPQVETAIAPREVHSEPMATHQPLDGLNADVRTAADIDAWSASIAGLEVQGLARQLLLHSELQNRAQGYVLVINEQQQALYGEQSEQHLRQELQPLIGSAALEIEFGRPQQTPFMIQQAIDAYRQQRAEQLVQEHPAIQYLQDTLAVHWVDGSIQPRD